MKNENYTKLEDCCNTNEKPYAPTSMTGGTDLYICSNNCNNGIRFGNTYFCRDKLNNSNN